MGHSWALPGREVSQERREFKFVGKGVGPERWTVLGSHREKARGQQCGGAGGPAGCGELPGQIHPQDHADTFLSFSLAFRCEDWFCGPAAPAVCAALAWPSPCPHDPCPGLEFRGCLRQRSLCRTRFQFAGLLGAASDTLLKQSMETSVLCGPLGF